MAGQLPHSLSDLQEELMPALQLALQQSVQRELQVALQQLRSQVQQDFKQEFDGFRIELEHAQQYWPLKKQDQQQTQSVTQRGANRRGPRCDSTTSSKNKPLWLGSHAKSYLVQTELNGGDDDEDDRAGRWSPPQGTSRSESSRRADSSASAIMEMKKRSRAILKQMKSEVPIRSAPDAWQDAEGEEAEQKRGVAKTPARTSEGSGHAQASERINTGNLDPLPVAQRLLLKADSSHSALSGLTSFTNMSGQTGVSAGGFITQAMGYSRSKSTEQCMRSRQESKDSSREGAMHPNASEIITLSYFRGTSGIVSLDDDDDVIQEPMSVVPSQKSVQIDLAADFQSHGLDELDNLGVGARLRPIPSEVVPTSTQGTDKSHSNLSLRRRKGCLCCTSGSEEMSPIQAACRNLIRHSYFDVASAALILVNSLTMGLQTDYMARHLHEQTPAAFRRMEMVFAVVFTLELSLRLVAYGCRFFTRLAWRWNVLDFSVVAMQLVETAMITLQLDSDNLSSLSMLRTMRILKLLRCVRMVRLLRYLDDLRTVLVSVMSAFKPLCSTLVLIGLIIYVTGIYFTELATFYRLQDARVEEDFANIFDSLAITMFRLFQTITGGINWADFSAPLMKHISPMMGFVFAVYITIMTLAILNIVTGVFVDAATQRSRKEKDVFMINNLKELFIDLDLNRNGMISWGEFQHHLHDDRLVAFFKDIDLDISEAQGLFMLLDRDDSGTLGIDEFLNGCLNLRGPARALDMQLLMREMSCSRQEQEE